MNGSVIIFIGSEVSREEIEGKRILEVGSGDINGSIRPVLMNWCNPGEYVGIDIEAGPGVDVVCKAEELVDQFGEASFDTIICCETMEHVRDWKIAISNMKRVCREGGIIVITTRSPGFKYHAFPHDYWRYRVADMAEIFSDFDLIANREDPLELGVFVKARKPANFNEKDLKDYALYSIITGSAKTRFVEEDLDHPHFQEIRAIIKRKEKHSKKRKIKKQLKEKFFGKES
jgi:ubiquinone/menaquinone biosynthesis C-methylase UbiE